MKFDLDPCSAIDFEKQTDIQPMLWIAFQRQSKYFNYQVVFTNSKDFAGRRRSYSSNPELSQHKIYNLAITSLYNLVSRLCYIHNKCTHCI